MRPVSKSSRAICLFSLFSLITTVLPLSSNAQEFLKPDPIEQFDGKTWSTLTIGESTTDSIKRAFKTSKGAIRPEAMLLPMPEGSKLRIDVLMHGRGGTSTLQGFRIGYRDDAPTLADLADRLHSEPEIRYPRDHFDDWSMAAFPEKGVVAFVGGSGRSARVDVVLLCSPSRVRDAIAETGPRPTTPLDVKDVFPDDKRILQVGRFNVDINTVKGMSLPDKPDVERELERRIRRMRTPRELDIVDSSTGSVSVSVSLNYKDRRVKVEATASVSGKTVLGSVSVSGSSEDSIREDRDNPEWRGSRNLENTVYDAVDRAYRNASEKVRSQKLPTLDQLRDIDWNIRIGRATP